MANRKSKSELKVVDSSIDPVRAKIVLLVFGIGPIVIIGIFLAMNGFFG
tara:strand:- start:463 stop:609 length:147 start_codon:yes stop_codon:yes gene_type:complete